jgi:hypothetical protein
MSFDLAAMMASLRKRLREDSADLSKLVPSEKRQHLPLRKRKAKNQNPNSEKKNLKEKDSRKNDDERRPIA